MNYEIRHEAPAISGRRGSCTWRFMRPALIKIHPDYRDDKGLLAHELYHARGGRWDHFVRSLRYQCSEKFRYKEELNAYAEQLHADWFDLTPEQRHKRIFLYIKWIKTLYDLPTKLTKNTRQDYQEILRGN